MLTIGSIKPIDKAYQTLYDLVNAGDPNRAIAAANQLLQKGGLSPDLFRVLGIASLATKQLDLARASLSRLLESGQGQTIDQMLLAISFSENAEPREALDIYKAIVEKEPDNAEAWIGIGSCLAELQQPEESISASKRALKIDPNNELAIWNLALMQASEGRFDEAEQNYKSLLGLKSSFSDTGLYTNLASILRQKGELEEADKLLEKASRLDPNCPITKRQQGLVSFAQGSWDQALHYFECLNDDSVLSKIIECYFLLGDLKRAKAELLKASVRCPTNIFCSAISSFFCEEYGWENKHPFCPNPLDMIRLGHLKQHVEPVENFVTELLVDLEQQRAVWEPPNVSTVGGSQTGNILRKPQGKISTLKDYIRNELYAYREYFCGEDNLLIRSWPERFDISGWFVSLQKGGHQAAHIHASGWVSGVVYLDTPREPTEREGSIQFGLQGYSLKGQSKSAACISHQPQAGDIVLFPSSLFHSTVPVMSDQSRKVFAFDMKPLSGTETRLNRVTKFLNDQNPSN